MSITVYWRLNYIIRAQNAFFHLREFACKLGKWCRNCRTFNMCSSTKSNWTVDSSAVLWPAVYYTGKCSGGSVTTSEASQQNQNKLFREIQKKKKPLGMAKSTIWYSLKK